MNDSRFGEKVPFFGCSECSRDFASLGAYDGHKTGKHSHEFSLARPDGRHCIDVSAESVWLLDDRGRWTTTKLSAQAVKLAEHHRRALMEPTEATEAA